MRTIVDSLAEDEDTPAEKYAEVQSDINNIITEVEELSRFTRQNYSGFIKIVKKHDKHTGYQLKPMFNVRLNVRNFYKQNYDNLLLQLSRLYDIVRNGGKKDSKKGSGHGGAQDFVRKTTKYWVHPDNVMELKLFVLQHLPVLVYNSKDEMDTADPAITSIYFDNDAFDLYLGRLEKSEGAEAIRLRWYGPVTNQEIFVERKTHREDWTGEKSVKQRFPIKEKYVNDFLAGKYSIDTMVKKMQERGKSQKEIDAFEQLASEVQDRVLEKGLKPAVRSFYNRTAFQLPGDAKVRISLDTELSLIREDNYGGVQRAGDNWRRTDIATDYPFSQLPESDICRFPYAILEVKLQTQLGAEPPIWVQQLVNSHLVEAVPKFSKYIHGVATLLEHHINLLPFWLPQMDVDIRREPTTEWKRMRKAIGYRSGTPSETSSDIFDQSTVGGFNNAAPQLKKKSSLGRLVHKINRVRDEEDEDPDRDELLENPKIIQLPTRVEPKVFFANERTFLTWLHFAIILATLALGLLNFSDRVGQFAASIFTIISLLTMGYSVVLFKWRAAKIRNRDEGPFDDSIGPLALVLALFMAIGVNFYLKIQYRNGNLPNFFYED
jgi:SPX domain protein involved in polyphosphate accumulation/uncharacterized membrane protein YidH (DUF202 family)